MKIFTTAGFKYCMTVLAIVFLSACAAPKKFSYDKEDAGTVYFSQTSNFGLSSAAAYWSFTFEAIDDKSRKEIPGGLTASVETRTYFGRKIEDFFKIINNDGIGNVTQSTKIQPGRYRIRSVNLQSSLSTPAYAKLYLVVKEAENFWTKKITTGGTEMPEIVFTVEPGKAVYLGSLNGQIIGCKDNLTNQGCEKFQIVIRDEFKRDSQLLKEQLAKRPQDPNFEFINRVLKIDRNASPYFFSE